MKVKEINVEEQNVTFEDNDTVLTHKLFMDAFLQFWDKLIIGKSIVPIFYEYLFGKGGSNALELLMKGKEHEGYLMGSMDKMLTPRQRIALITIFIAAIIIIIIFVMVKNTGLIPGFE